jgi:hypothetical protein
LFAGITFQTPGPRVERWKKTFPDPTNSPAHHIRTLLICHPYFTTAANLGTVSTICGSVVRLVVCTIEWYDDDGEISLIPLHGLSPVLRSLHLTFASLPDSQIFGLICSLPLLEDLALVSLGYGDREEGWNAPSASPRLAGSLELCMVEGIRSTTRRLLDLTNGLHFAKITVVWYSEEDVPPTMELVSRCSDTLQSLSIASDLSGVFRPATAPDRKLTATRRHVRDGCA